MRDDHATELQPGHLRPCLKKIKRKEKKKEYKHYEVVGDFLWWCYKENTVIRAISFELFRQELGVVAHTCNLSYLGG